LDKVLLIPEAKPRYKAEVADIDTRIKMISLATQDVEHIEPYKAWEQTHTINGLMSEILQLHPESEFCILMGSDVFRSIGEWGSRPDEDGGITELSKGVGFIVGLENSSEAEELETLAKKLEVDARLVELPIANLASRKIRMAIKDGQPPRGLNDAVWEYIEASKLYS
jgi:nicotinic acid mononucleotide adenylyltransferase